MIDKKSILREFIKRENTVNRIMEWNIRAEKEKDAIAKFIFRWISFNGLYSSLYDVIHMEEKAVGVREIDVLTEFCEDFIETDNNLASKMYSKEREEKLKKNIKDRARLMGKCLDILENPNSNEGKATAMVKIAYIVRCRLFHGDKNPLLEVNQDTVGVADQVITPIINSILFS
ncbi:hypothetical protein LCGC14_0616380 [marine sediment metagenome]|uniref:Uncharacterized protein n=1 Tax=marine sediment metagenome TaxID=412755 RepID=A0A0F9UEL9_9ZZZZ|nr:hypothetical protein [bacterium]